MTRSWVRYLAGGGAVVAGVALLWFLFGPLTTWIGGSDLARLNPNERLAALSSIRTLIGSVLSAAVVGGGLYYTGRKFFLDRDKQFTDRFNAAIDHLGSADETVRAGGVRALDRILHDSPADRNRVLASLTGFLRHRTVAASSPDHDDISAALAALRNRGLPPKRQAGDNPLDLRGIRVAQTVLREMPLHRADLSSAELTGTVLADADLGETRLCQATLINADLSGAVLAKADLTDTRLSRANLSSADLRGATLRGADFAGAVFDGTDIRGTDLTESRGLTEEQLAQALTDPATSTPEYLGTSTADRGASPA
ncbi:pentapeptide repeat-containing protein [Amycolatopsis sp. lyj-112]|uniref:pentapeptide repeat-containing protein n=1 Tax=Amycolatopsis sp. lyj-112 TaxID=2789288 RepID=UPI00397978F2